MRWCRCYEGQRDEAWGCQVPSHTGLSIIHTIYIDPTEVGSDIIFPEVELRKPRNLFVCVIEEREDGDRGDREGEDTQSLPLWSGAHRIHNSLVEHADRLSVVELRELRNLCVSEWGAWTSGGGGCAWYTADRYTKESRQSHRKYRQNTWVWVTSIGSSHYRDSIYCNKWKW